MKVCVIGLGYIGLPTAALLASRGIDVLGVDVIPEVVDTINSGKIHIEEPELDMLVHGAVNAGKLKASICPTEADVFIITVPTPLTLDNEPDVSYVMEATQSISSFIKRGDCVILESTSPIGTTEKMRDWLCESRADLTFSNGGNSNPDVHIAYCPERVLPGRIIHELVNNDRLVGGLCAQSTERAIAFYQHFVDAECIPTNANTAEMAKLTENAFRDVNIAFANELSMICDNNGVNVWELIRLANHHPRVNILQPGPGVGGHCIAVDPWFIVAGDKRNSKLIKKAREVNLAKSKYVLDKVLQSIQNNPSAKIACLGLAFKPDIDDLRESPALLITQALEMKTSSPIYVVEPHIDTLPSSLDETRFRLVELTEAFQADIIIILVKHSVFESRLKNQNFSDKYIIDTVGILEANDTVRQSTPYSVIEHNEH